MKLYRALSFFAMLALVISACGGAASPAAPTEPPPTPAPVSAEPQGPYRITGTLTFTNQFVTVASLEDAVALADMHGFVTRDLEWQMPAESQTLGYINLDRKNLTGDYWIQLPAKPEGQFADVDNNDHSDLGVQVFAAAYWPNYLGGPFSEGDDPSLGWVEDLASVKTDSENHNEVIGGKLVVWAPDNGQQFPAGFGDDGLLFTKDDPVGPIPAGWSIVDLDQKPFAISQEAEPTLDLYERPDSATKDYSALSYTEAFDKLFERVSTDWAFNGSPGKEVDWQKLYQEIAPRVADAEKKKDKIAFYKALRDFAISIPDGHTGLNGGAMQDAEFARETDGGFGFAIRELDGGKVVVVYVMPGGPAEQAGMQVGAEITEFNGDPIGGAIGTVIAYYVAPFSEESFKRYQQARYLLRTPVGTEATVTFANPGGEPQTAALTSIAERDSFRFTSIYKGSDSTALPVEYRILDSGIGYVKLNTNLDDIGLIVRVFVRALKVFQDNGVTTLIVDLRQNGGGFPIGLAGFLYDKEIVQGQLEYYSEQTGQFEPEGRPDKITPYKDQFKFDKIAVLVGQACFSACEIEADGLSKIPGTVVVGMFPTGGVEAEVGRGQFDLPEGMSMQIPTGRIVNQDGSLFLEGTGVVPTVRVPINEAHVLAATDVELQAAEDVIFGVNPDDLKIEGGPVLGAPPTSEAALKARTKFLFEVANERYSNEELAQIGKTFTYTIALDKDQRLMWYYGWCATSQDILKQNFEHIRLEFSVNGAPVALQQFAVLENETSGMFCKNYFTVVYKWPSGATTLVTKATFDEKINDGTADYPAGAQTAEYTVTLP